MEIFIFEGAGYLYGSILAAIIGVITGLLINKNIYGE